MTGILAAIASAFGIVFIAELGDKTQLLAVNFGSRYTPRQALIGLVLGYGAASLIAVAVGGLLGARLPRRPIEIAGGLVFIAFGLLAMRPEAGQPDEVETSPLRSSAVATIGLAIFIGEMGDKTQIATTTLAARSTPIGTWIGATAGAASSGMVGVVAGSLIGDRIPATAMRWLSATLFVAFGITLLVDWR